MIPERLNLPLQVPDDLLSYLELPMELLDSDEIISSQVFLVYTNLFKLMLGQLNLFQPLRQRSVSNSQIIYDLAVLLIHFL